MFEITPEELPQVAVKHKGTQKMQVANSIAFSFNKPVKDMTQDEKKNFVTTRVYNQVQYILVNGTPEEQNAGRYGSQEIASIYNGIKKRLTREVVGVFNFESDKIGLHHGDFREYCTRERVPDDSVDLIITDPPYPKEFLSLWDDLAILAKRVLKPSGFLIVYSGQMYALEIQNKLRNHLSNFWIVALEHKGNKQLIEPRNLFCNWKPIFIFQKEPFKTLSTDKNFDDLITGGGREKVLHDWAQATSELDSLIKAFSNEDELILDPFAGSGTTLIASHKNKRRSLGVEIDGQTFNIATKRIAEYLESVKQNQENTEEESNG